jgi:hypothetical protein
MIRETRADPMLIKLHIIYGLKEAKQFKIKFLCFAVYDTVDVTNCLICSV